MLGMKDFALYTITSEENSGLRKFNTNKCVWHNSCLGLLTCRPVAGILFWLRQNGREIISGERSPSRLGGLGERGNPPQRGLGRIPKRQQILEHLRQPD